MNPKPPASDTAAASSGVEGPPESGAPTIGASISSSKAAVLMERIGASLHQVSQPGGTPRCDGLSADAIADVRGKGRFDHGGPLERDVGPRHPVEETLASAEQERCDRERERIDDARVEILTKEVGPSQQDDVLRSRRATGAREGCVDAVGDEIEGRVALDDRLVGPVRDDEHW